MDDVAQLRRALGEVERSARSLPWAAQRPWKVGTHVYWASELPEIDLHDLDVRHAKDVARAVAASPPKVGAVRFVTGRGRHSARAGGVLGPAIGSELRGLADGKPWSVRPSGAARWVLITDAAAAPASATGELGWGFRLLVAAFGAAAAAAIGHALGLL